VLRFSAEHRQNWSHGLRLRAEPVVAEIIGYRLPDREKLDTAEAREKYAVGAIALFVPFRSREEVLGPHKTFWNAWLAYEQSDKLSAEDRACLAHAQDFYLGKKRAAEARQLAEQEAIDGGAGGLDDGRPFVDGDESDYGDDDFGEHAGELPVEEDGVALERGPQQLHAHAQAAVTALQALGALVAPVQAGPPPDRSRVSAAAVQAELELRLGRHLHASTDVATELPLEPLPSRRQVVQPASLELLDEYLERAMRKKPEEDAMDLDAPAELQAGLMAVPFPHPIDVVKAFTLKGEQVEAALWMMQTLLVAWYNKRQAVKQNARFVNHHPRPMLLLGRAGTGKSHVINAVRHFAKMWGRPNAVALAAPTGVAATNIGGSTTFSALGCGRDYKGGEITAHLRDYWLPVDIFFIDELSFLDLESLPKIDRRVREIRRPRDLDGIEPEQAVTIPFDGISIVLAGDFAQLPPPGGRLPLYRAVDVREGVASAPKASTKEKRKEGQRKEKNKANTVADAQLGANLYLAFKTVVTLTEVRRQEGDKPFAAFLEQTRKGALNLGLINWINRRHHSNLSADEKRLLVADGLPLIVVPSNAARHALNLEAARQAAAAGAQIIRVDAPFDTSGRAGPLDIAARAFIGELGDEDTDRLPLHLYLYLNMPVMVTHNLAVELGVANGTTGSLAHWQFPADCALTPVLDDALGGARVLLASTLPEFALIRIDAPRFDRFQSLGATADGLFPIFPLKGAARVPTGPGKLAPTVSITLTSLPLVPANAITIHKAQGISLNTLIIGSWRTADRHSATLQQVYVALSRVRSSQGLLLLQELPLSFLGAKPPAALDTEMARLKQLNDLTHAALVAGLRASGQPLEEFA
jgi:hypothetical protein